MKNNSIWQFPFYPLALSLAAILNLYSRSMYTYEASYLVAPLAVSTLIVLAIWYFCGFASRNKHLRSLHTTMIVVALLAYGNAYSLSGAFTGILPWIYGPALFLSIWWSRRFNFINAKFTILLNTIATALLVSGLFSIISFHLRETRMVMANSQPLSNEMALEQLIYTGNSPNIYHIILDEYAISEVLQSLADFDNSEFINHLNSLGFIIPTDSRSNYAHTTFSLPSLLNFSFLTDFEINSYTKFQTENTINKIRGKNNTFRSLRQAGYEILTTPTTIKQGEVAEADRQIGKSGLNSFYLDILSNTPLRHYLDKHRIVSDFNAIKRSLNALPELAEAESGPFYVFSHIRCPHPPIWFEKNGQFYFPEQNYTPENAQEYRENYRQQLLWLNKQVIRIVEEILVNSKKPPIIIIQGDHGIRERLSYTGQPIPTIHWYGNFIAMFLPGQDATVVSKDFSLVNTYRLVFNLYFGTNYQILPNLCENKIELTEKYEKQLNELRLQLQPNN